MSRQPEARTARDGVPVESGSPLTRADTFEAFQPALDDERRTNPIGDTIADVFGAPEPPRDPFAEPTPIPSPFGEPQEVDEVDSVPVRVTMAMRLESLRKDREAAREV
jgi:hypothetical protein